MRRLPATPAAITASLLAVAWAAGLSWGVVAGASRMSALEMCIAGAGAMAVAGGCPPVLRRWMLGAAVIVTAAGCGLLRGSGATPSTALTAGGVSDGPVVIQGTVRDAPTRRHSESLLVVDVDVLTGGGGSSRPGGAILVAVPGAVAALPGDRVRVDASGLRAPGARPGAESAAALDREGVAAIAVSPRVTVTGTGEASATRWIAQARSRLSTATAQALPEPTATLVDEFALGVRGSLPADVSNPLQDAGLIHLVATSGLKVALLISLLLRALTFAAAPPRVRVAVVVITTAAYVVITGGGPAAIRAAVMATVALTLAPSGRRTEPMALLAVVGALMLALSPRLCVDVGFQLSFLGTAGILLLADPICRHLPGPRLVAEPIGVTVAAQLATFPVMASTFGVISLAGPLANGLAVPMMPVLLCLGWSGAVLAQLHPLLGWLPLQLAGLVVTVILGIARAAAALPFAAIHVAVWPDSWTIAEALAVAAAVITVVATRAWHPSQPLSGVSSAARSGRRPGGHVAVGVAAALSAAVAAATVLVVAARPDGRLHIAVLAVGAAPAVLVTTPDGGRALVDGGSDPARLAQAVGTAVPSTLRTIDVLIITGGERAAIAGLDGLASHYTVSHVMAPDIQLSAGAATLLGSLRASGVDVASTASSWSWGGASWRFVCAGPDTTAQGTPMAGCALQVAAQGGTALLLGDVAPAQQEEVAGLFGTSLATDLVVTPPGGALAAAFVDVAQPHHVAIPSVRSVRRNPGLGAAVVRDTATDGTLEYAGSGTGLVIA